MMHVCPFSFPLRPRGSRDVAALYPPEGLRAYWGQIQFYLWVKARVHPE